MGTGFVDSLKSGLSVLALLAMVAPALADGPAASGSLKDAPAAEPKRDWTVAYNFGVTTDYVFRGISQSGERPAVQAGVDVTYKLFYVGAWSSLIDFGKDGNFPTRDVAHTEIDLYAGIKPVVGPVTFDLGVIYYTYPNSRTGGQWSNQDFNYVELKVGASGEIWKDGTLSGTVFYSPEGTNKTGEVITLEGTFTQAFPKFRDITPTFSGTLGYQTGDSDRYKLIVTNGSSDYLYWNAGMTFGFGDRFSLDFRYWDTNIKTDNAAGGFANGFCDARIFGCDERFVATAKVTY